jgi:hypothetical protein
MTTGLLNTLGQKKLLVVFAVAVFPLLVLSCATRKWNGKISTEANATGIPAQERGFALGPIDRLDYSFASAWRLANYGTTPSPKYVKRDNYTDRNEEIFKLAAMRQFGLEKGFRRIVEITRSHGIVLERLAQLDALVSKRLTENWRDFMKAKADTGDSLDPWKFAVRRDFFSIGRRTIQEVLKELENGNGYSGYVNIFGFVKPGQKPTLEDLVFRGLLINDFHDFGRGELEANSHKVFPHRIQQAIIILDYRQNPTFYDAGKTPADYYKATGNAAIQKELEFEETYRGEGKNRLWGALFDYRNRSIPAYPDSLSELTYHFFPVLDFTAEGCGGGPWWTSMKAVTSESSAYPDIPTDADSEILAACKKLNAEIRADMTCPGESCR